ncbi:unnamed protein product [Adineta ricciae]|uniref:SAM domain-containing protein n=1 Tax=Adineta ricciae TaxID=249248 RepID=A0A814MMG8_ADIRI|nr:unnamed protein product [Adineta ricciae]
MDILPSYETITGTVTNKMSNQLWETWYRKLVTLNFNQDEAAAYAKLFVQNEVVIDMIPELNDSILKSIGIEKAGHRIRILRLQNKASLPSLSASPPPQEIQSIVPAAINIPRCSWHPNVPATEKCRRCNRLVCLSCRRVKPTSNGTHYYCENCHNDCVIL